MSKLVLIVEDDAKNIKLLCDLLAAWGYRSATAVNGKEGVEMAASLHPDLVLMDLRMPVMDGLTATQKIRQDPNTQHTPIVMLTSSAMKGDSDRVLQAGCNEYCSKPFDIRELRSLIARYTAAPA